MDFTFKTFQRRVKIGFDEPLPFWIWGDVHYDAASCDRDRFDWFLHKAARDENALYIGMGDYHDFASSKEQKKMLSAELHDQTYELFDNLVQKRNREFAGLIGQMRPGLLGLIGGNHTWKLLNGKYADEDLAERLAAPYLGWLCVYRIAFELPSGKTTSVYVVACHGTGGGKLVGSSINGVDDLKRIFPFADVYIMGHNHQRMAVPTSTLLPMNSGRGTDEKFRLKEHRQFLVRSGSFMKSYEENKSQYTTARLLRPADLGAVKLNISFHRERKGNEDAIITDIESVV